ncbi:MAG: trehalose-phosphatase [Desulfuromonadaceae bacterium]|nr:trehalose-phosphatase [Desulfuromonadaceae bacterium]MDD5105404.1 trehalose-phosphatase [Desulfuromonadaceae bacterium]
MTYLFSETGLAALDTSIDASTLFAFDLDGTLAPIVADPGNIAIPDDIRCQLTALNRIAAVVVITGRSRCDALTHLGFTPAYVVGNHGAEGLPGREEEEREYARLCSRWKKQLCEMLTISASGIFLEDKGATLALHYRNARDHERVHEEILSAVSRLVPPPRAGSGKCVVNISPQGAPHKGDAILSLMNCLGHSRALFIGDDETDEDVFRLHDCRIMGIRIGMNAQSAAHYYLQNQLEISAVLERVKEAVVLKKPAGKS